MLFYVVGPQQSMLEFEYPVVLLYRSNWDDYGYRTTFNAIVALDQNRLIEVGTVKILHSLQVNGGYTPVPDVPFDGLGEQYCSLGQSLGYYHVLKQLGTQTYTAVLTGLRDVVFDPSIAERFIANRGFRESLERFGSSVRAISDAASLFRTIPSRGDGEPLQFRFATSVGGSRFIVPFSFNETPGIPGRINALIGYNGTGKTRLLTNLALVAHADLKKRAKQDFIDSSGALLGENDLRFSSVITVSYSAFDTFEVPGGDDEEEQGLLNQTGDVFGHVYSGLRAFGRDPKVADRLKNQAEIAKDFEDALNRTNHPIRKDATLRALAHLLEEPSFLRLGVDLDSLYEPRFMSDQFPSLSTGHKIVLTIVLQLGAHLNLRSLVVVDEPESHLHPPLLAALLRSITGMLEEYDSFGVVATHSPVILQEVPRRYVFILRRFGSTTSVERPERETFGENVGFLTRNVFNLDSSSTDFHAVLKGLALRYSTEEIEQLFGNALNAQARTYVEAVRRSGGGE